MLKILFKAAVLFLIVVSIYLIVNPHACSNMLAGRERLAPNDGTEVRWQHPFAEQGPYLSHPDPRDEMLDSQQQPPAHTDFKQPAYSQADADYAIAKRYVELEQEYANAAGNEKDKSRELSYIVMQDFEMTPEEWAAFLTRATANDLFEKVRHDMQEENKEKEK